MKTLISRLFGLEPTSVIRSASAGATIPDPRKENEARLAVLLSEFDEAAHQQRDLLGDLREQSRGAAPDEQRLGFLRADCARARERTRFLGRQIEVLQENLRVTQAAVDARAVMGHATGITPRQELELLERDYFVLADERRDIERAGRHLVESILGDSPSRADEFELEDRPGEKAATDRPASTRAIS